MIYQTEASELAIDTLAECSQNIGIRNMYDDDVIEACKQTLEQEPVGWWRQGADLDESDYYPAVDFPDLDTTNCIPLYTSPQLKPYVPLIEGIIVEIFQDYPVRENNWADSIQFARAIEQAVLAKLSAQVYTKPQAMDTLVKAVEDNNLHKALTIKDEALKLALIALYDDGYTGSVAERERYKLALDAHLSVMLAAASALSEGGY